MAIKLLVVVGFGIDVHHGVTDAAVLEAIAALAKTGDFLGAWSLVDGTSDVELYERAVAFALRNRAQTSHPRRVRRLSRDRAHGRQHAAHQPAHDTLLGISPRRRGRSESLYRSSAFAKRYAEKRPSSSA